MSAPDGYTILFVSSSYTVNVSLYAKPPYDPDKFCTGHHGGDIPEWACSSIPMSFRPRPSRNWWICSKPIPAKYTFASPGIGTTPHLSSLPVEAHPASIRAGTVPGWRLHRSSQWSPDTRPSASRPFPPAIPLVKDGKLRALESRPKSARRRAARVPTFEEAGIMGQEAETRRRAAAGRHAEGDRRASPVGDRAHRRCPDVSGKLLAIGLEPMGHADGGIRGLRQGRDRQVEEGHHRREDPRGSECWGRAQASAVIARVKGTP